MIAGITKWVKRRQLNNQGAAIVSVIVVTAFITILATVMLYISTMNYQMKQTDYQNKVSFYQAECAVDELKALLVNDVEAAYEEAYRKVMTNYARLGAAEREKCYAEAYTDALMEIWQERTRHADLTQAIRSYMQSNGIDEALTARITIEETGGYGVSAGQFVLKGIYASYTSSSGYTTYIRTDIGLQLPEYDVTTDSYAAWAGGEALRETVQLSECVVYMNWQKD